MLLSSFVGLAEASDKTVFRYAQRWGLLTVRRDQDVGIRDVLCQSPDGIARQVNTDPALVRRSLENDHPRKRRSRAKARGR